MTRSSGSPIASTADQLSGIMRTLETMAQVMQQQQQPIQQGSNDGTETSNQTGFGIEQFKKLSPPSFSGESDPMVAKRWMM